VLDWVREKAVTRQGPAVGRAADRGREGGRGDGGSEQLCAKPRMQLRKDDRLRTERAAFSSQHLPVIHYFLI